MSNSYLLVLKVEGFYGHKERNPYPRTLLKTTSLASSPSLLSLGGTHLARLGEPEVTTATGCWFAGVRSEDTRTSLGPWKSRDFAPRPSTFVFSCHNRGNTTKTWGRNCVKRRVETSQSVQEQTTPLTHCKSFALQENKFKTLIVT